MVVNVAYSTRTRSRVGLIFATADPAHRRVSGGTWNENGIVSFCRRVDVCHISAILVYLVEWL